MDKSLDEIIGNARPAPVDKSSSPAGTSQRGVSKRRSGRRGRSGRGAAAGGPARDAKTVYIRNLSDSISEDDLRDLFRQVGPVVRVHVDRDNGGARTGMAWVVYDFADDALVAAERYNQRRAAGKIISLRRVAHVGDTGAGHSSLGDRIGDRSLRDSAAVARGADRGTRSRRNRKARGSERPTQPAKPRSQEELDAELDAYMQVESAVPSAAGAPQAPASGSAPAPPAEESMIDV